MVATVGNVTRFSTSVTFIPPSRSNTFDHDNDGDDVLLFVILESSAAQDVAEADFTSSATYNSVAMDPLDASEDGYRDDIPRIEAFFLKGAASGVNEIEYFFDPDGNNVNCQAAFAISLSGAGQAGNTAPANSDAGVTTLSADINAAGSESLLIGVAAAQQGDQVMTPGTGYARIGADLATGGGAEQDVTCLLQQRTSPGSGNQAFAASWDQSDDSSILGVEILSGSIGSDGDVTTGTPTVSGSSAVVVSSVGSVDTALPIAAGASAAVVNSSGSVVTALPSVSGASAVLVQGDGSVATAAPMASGTGSLDDQNNGAGAVSTEAPTVSATSAVIQIGDGSAQAVLPIVSGVSTVVVDGSGTPAAAIPTLSAGSSVIVSGSGAVSAILPTVSGSGGLATIGGTGVVATGLPVASGSSTAIVSGDGAAITETPAVTAASSILVVGSGSVTAGLPTLSGAGSKGILPSVGLPGKFADDVTLRATNGIAVNAGGSFGTAP